MIQAALRWMDTGHMVGLREWRSPAAFHEPLGSWESACQTAAGVRGSYVVCVLPGSFSERSKGCPWMRWYMSRTSLAVVSKCEVASYPLEMKHLSCLPSERGSYRSLTSTNFSSMTPSNARPAQENTLMRSQRLRVTLIATKQGHVGNMTIQKPVLITSSSVGEPVRGNYLPRV